MNIAVDIQADHPFLFWVWLALIVAWATVFLLVAIQALRVVRAADDLKRTINEAKGAGADPAGRVDKPTGMP